jgi:hypothetical protein
MRASSREKATPVMAPAGSAGSGTGFIVAASNSRISVRASLLIATTR